MIKPLNIERVVVTCEKVSKGLYVFNIPVLSVAGLYLSVLMPRRYFVSNYLRKCLREHVRGLKQDGIAYPSGLDNKRIKIIIEEL